MVFGLTKCEKFRKHVKRSKLSLTKEQLLTVLVIIKDFRIDNKISLIAKLKTYIGRSVVPGDPPHPAYDKPRWDYFQSIVNIIEKELSDLS